MSVSPSDEIIVGYIEEVKTYIPSLQKGIAALNENPNQKKEMEEVHRLVHTIKGASSMVGIYGLSHIAYQMEEAMDEIMALAYSREKGLAVVIVRCFNTCGPRQTGQYGMVLPRFVAQALAGEPITVYGDGTQTRCFASVYDVVEGIATLAECDDAVGGILNIGSNKEVTIGDLARKVIELTSSSSTLEYVPYDKAYGEGFEDMMRRVPDLSRIKALIGYEPRRSLDDIVQSVIDHQRS